MKFIRSLLICAMFATPMANAKSSSEVKFIAAHKAVKNLSTAMTFINKNSDMPAIFPKHVPKNKKIMLYAITGGVGEPADYNKHWWINAVNSPTCIVHSCIIGSVDAEKNGKLASDYEVINNGSTQTMAKEKIELANHTIAYYTPAHAEADWHLASIEWEDKSVLYQISWDIKGDSKRALTAMANSAIAAVTH